MGTPGKVLGRDLMYWSHSMRSNADLALVATSLSLDARASRRAGLAFSPISTSLLSAAFRDSSSSDPSFRTRLEMSSWSAAVEKRSSNSARMKGVYAPVHSEIRRKDQMALTG